MDTNDTALTDEEVEALKAAGYEPLCKEEIDGTMLLRFRRNGITIASTRTEWRAVIRGLAREAAEDEIAFGQDAWIYCNQHMRAHQTGWCTVAPMDKAGLGVSTATEARAKCKAWGFRLYEDIANDR